MMKGAANTRIQAANSHFQFVQNHEAQVRLAGSEVGSAVEDSALSQLSRFSG